MFLHLGYKGGFAIVCILVLAGCGESTIDKKEVSATISTPSYPTVTVTAPCETETVTAPPVTIVPQPTPTKQQPTQSSSPQPPQETPTASQPPQPPPSSSSPQSAAPATVEEFLNLVKLDASYIPYTAMLKGDGGVPIGYHIASTGRQLPSLPVPPGVVLDTGPDGNYTGSYKRSWVEWVDENCGLVYRMQAGPTEGKFDGTSVTYYWSGWANPPAAPEWCN